MNHAKIPGQQNFLLTLEVKIKNLFTDINSVVSKSWIISVYLIVSAGCNSNQPENQIPLIIDADTANEVDDLFALVRAIKEPHFNLLGITAAQFHNSPLASDSSANESQQMNEDILRLMNLEKIPALKGSNFPLADYKNPKVTAASTFIVTQARKMTSQHPLHLAILGSCTNVATAILQDTTIIPKIVVHYLGFWHDPYSNTYDKKEFNSGNDTLGIELLLNTKYLKFDVMTATTSQHLVFDKTEVDSFLTGKGGIADYLVDRWENFDRWWTDEDPEKRHWIMWDLALIEALARPELAVKETFTTPPENTKRYIGVYTSIESREMADSFWKSIASIYK